MPRALLTGSRTSVLHCLSLSAIAALLLAISDPANAQDSTLGEPSFDLIFLDEAPDALPEIPVAATPATIVLHAQPAIAHIAPQTGRDLAGDLSAPLLRELPSADPVARLASLTPPTASHAPSLDARARVIGTDITPPSDTPSIEDDLTAMSAEDLARELQDELARVGCYRLRVDGQWGPGSRRALENYLTRSDQSTDGREPSPEIIRMVRASEGEICPAPVARAPVAATPAPRTTAPTRQPAQTTAQPPRQAAPAPAPAAPSSGGSRLQGAIRGGLR